jgi:hypothetical protein
MILDFPSGFYKNILPPSPENRGNVTYVISTEAPPRGALFFLKIANNLAVASPSLVATDPQGTIQFGTLRSFRNISVIDTSPRPIGSVLEFNDEYKTLDVRNGSLDESVDFPRFSNVSTDPVNAKLYQAYVTAQKQLLTASQESSIKQVQIENTERSTNAAISSLQATQEALKILVNDQELLDTVTDLESQIAANESLIDTLRDEILALDVQRSQLADSVRRLSKVIS